MQVRFPAWAIFFNDDGVSSSKARALMRVQSKKPERAKQSRKHAQSAKPKGAKPPNRHAGMSAETVGDSVSLCCSSQWLWTLIDQLRAKQNSRK